MVRGYVKDSCIIVYTAPRYGRPVEPCLTSYLSDSGSPTKVLGRNKVKFEKNGCRKVDRENSCNLKMIRG